MDEKFKMGLFPRATINAAKSQVKKTVLGEMVEAKVRGSIVPVISWLEPKD